jgi:hypothetical protein
MPSKSITKTLKARFFEKNINIHNEDHGLFMIPMMLSPETMAFNETSWGSWPFGPKG